MIARRRPGYALIELLVLITAMTVMLGLCAGMIHLLLKLDRVGLTASDEAADMARLGHDFRADAHAAPPEGPRTKTDDKFTLTIAPGQAVDYEIRPGDILRTARDGDKVRRRETYRRPERSSVRFELTTDGPSPIASLIIAGERGENESRPGREFRIDAAIGLDRRHAPRAE